MRLCLLMIGALLLALTACDERVNTSTNSVIGVAGQGKPTGTNAKSCQARLVSRRPVAAVGPGDVDYARLIAKAQSSRRHLPSNAGS